MIISPLTNWGAQHSYDRVKDDKGATMNNREMALHFMMQSINLVAEIAPIAVLTSMANPHKMSYLYEGLDAAKFGIRAAEASRREFQMASSKAYQLGSRAVLGAANFARLPTTRSTTYKLARLGGKAGFRLIPGVGWAMLAYDVYDLAANRRLLGINL